MTPHHLVSALNLQAKISIKISLTIFSQSQGYSASIIHPCYPVGLSVNIKLDSIFNSPCSEKYKAQTYNSQSSLKIRGGGHYEHCLGNVSEIFSFDNCIFSQCSFDNVFQPNVTGSFVVRTTGQDTPTQIYPVLNGKSLSWQRGYGLVLVAQRS